MFLFNKNSELVDVFMELLPDFKQAFFFTVVFNLLLLAPIGYMNDVYGPVLNSRSFKTLFFVTMLLLVALIIYGILQWVRSRILINTSIKFSKKISSRVFEAAFVANLRNIPGAGNALRDMVALRTFIQSPGLESLLDAPVSLVFLALVFLINLKMGLVALVTALLLIIIGYLSESKISKSLKNAQDFANQANTIADSSLKNIVLCSTMGIKSSVKEAFIANQNRAIQAQVDASKLAATASNLSKVIMIAQGSVLLGVGCLLTLMGHIQDNGSSMIIASILGSRAGAPLFQVIVGWKTIVGAQLAFERLDNFLKQIPTEKSGMTLPEPIGMLEVDRVFLNHPGTRTPFLKSVSFSASQGTVTLLIGPSGSGKSTLLRAIVGLIPCSSGNVRLDGADIFSWNKTELGPFLGYLPQQVDLFNGTIAENIGRFSQGTLDMVELAAELTNIHKMIANMKNKYDTAIGDGGRSLSGGQKQKIALARAIFGHPKLIVLDEPNSNLDEHDDLQLIETIKKLKKKGCTIVVASHKRNLLSVVDQIVLMDNGQVKIFGPRDEVLQKLEGKTVSQPKSESKSKSFRAY
jgi:ATP-binding cassette subfamily C exporter for protease/lipase